MIREFKRDDINKVADIWLDTNIKAHNFIPAEYWKSNFKSVKEVLQIKVNRFFSKIAKNTRQIAE